MKCLLILGLVVYFCGMATITEARWGHRPTHTIAASIAPEMTTANTFATTNAHPNHNNDISSSSSASPSQATEKAEVMVKGNPDDVLEVKDHYCSYHPVAVKQPRIVEQYDQRSADGLYEYRYVLSNGVTHYERAYWKPLDHGEEVLARKGFYSYPLPNGTFITVYYTADENGFHQDPAKYTQTQPALPESHPVPIDIESTVMNAGQNSRK